MYGKDDSNYDNHPSIISIKQHITEKNKVFSFRNLTKDAKIAKSHEITKKPLYLMTYLPKSLSSLVKFLRIFFLITSIVT